MRLCSQCGEVYEDAQTECRQDGTALVPWVTSSLQVSVSLPARALATTHHLRGPNSAVPAPISDAIYIEKLDEPPGEQRVLARRYVLGQQLGVGGFGVVFEGRDLRLDKPVAVKLLSPRVSADEDALARFRIEALAASRIGHENIVAVTDFDRDQDGTSFIVMELLQGRDVAATLDIEDYLSPSRALSIAAQVAFALHAAHRKGILHRDLKPANVYLVTLDSREDFVKVIDFGISKVMSEAAGGHSGMTSRGIVLGTPRYMAPEQARGQRDLDGRVDIYALGVILFEMLTGSTPFDGGTHIEVVAKHLTAEPPTLASLRPELAGRPELEALVARALAKDPEARPATMEAFGQSILEALAAIDPMTANIIRPARLRSASGQAAPSGPLASSGSVRQSAGELVPSQPVARPRRRWGWVAGVAAVAVAAAAVMLVREQAAPRAAHADDALAAAPRPGAPPVVVTPPAAAAAEARMPAPARTVRVTSDPPGAEAFGDGGATLGRVPVEVPAPQGEGVVRVVLRAEGYVDREVLVRADTPAALEVPLERARGRGRKAGGRPPRDIARDW